MVSTEEDADFRVDVALKTECVGKAGKTRPPLFRNFKAVMKENRSSLEEASRILVVGMN